jgi:oligopeptide/dipeptide ABC transporter ATP-binding protein
VLNLLEELQQKLGLTLLLIAHNLAVVRHVCDRVAVMYLGRIVETAPTNELYTNARHPYTQGLLRAVPKLVPGRVSEAAAVVGDPPSPIRLPSGCHFHPRCPIAQVPVCTTDDPPLTAGSGLTDHVAACHFAWTAKPAPHLPEVAR